MVLDTNHLSAFERASEAGIRLHGRLRSCGDDIATTIVCAEEQMRGRLADLQRLAVRPHEQIEAYRHFHNRIDDLARWQILPWNKEAADLFVTFRSDGVRIGTMDLKIACISIANGALLLTQNTVDFAKVSGLRFENWLDG
jgi:tRNA(fMet)-specific endonuclease VapC